ncbi:MAG: hypothetical protein ACC652_09195 [Acidimicrobiales bacterium]
MAGDVSNEAQVRQALAETVDRFGGIDIAVVAAGIFGSSTRIEGCAGARHVWSRLRRDNWSAGAD